MGRASALHRGDLVIIPETALSSRFPSPLRYPGGKGKLANFIKLLILENGLAGRSYVEPYAGGAGVALSLLFEDYVNHVHINDYDPRVYAFWLCVLEHTNDLCARIAETEVTVEEWERQKIVNDGCADTLDLGFSTFYLNRTNRSGIIHGGMIGGRKQTGRWRLDARFHREELVRRIRKASRFRSRITLTNLDAAEMLRTLRSSEDEPRFAYLDPPYYKKGQGLYPNFYHHQDHVEIAHLLGGLDWPWVVTYDAVPEILHLYYSVPSLHYTLSYTAGARYRGSEVMLFSPTLKLPPLSQPTGITESDVAHARRVAYSHNQSR